MITAGMVNSIAVQSAVKPAPVGRFRGLNPNTTKRRV
jgi:hypothetical protein